MTATPVGFATLGIVPSAAGFGAALRRDVGGNLKRHGDLGGRRLGVAAPAALMRAIPVLAAAAATAAIAAGVASAIKQAGALEQSVGAIRSVFKENQSTMLGWSQGAALAVGLTRNEFNELGTLIGSQLKNAGVAMDQLAPQTNNLIGLGADLASMFGGTSREAIEAISSALKGERDPIEKYGVSLRQTAIDAKAAELGFQKVDGALTAEANAAATLALIMEQTADAHGNFAKESTTYEGVMQRLSASWGNISTTIGQGFLPFATAAGAVLLGMMPTIQGVADGFAAFGANMQQAFSDAGGGMAGIGAMLTSIFTGAAHTLPVLLGGILTAAQTVLTVHLPAAMGTLAEALPGALDWYARIYAPAALAFQLALVGAVLEGLAPLSLALWGIVPALTTTLLGLVPALLTAGLQLFLGLASAVLAAVPLIVQALVAMLPALAASLLTMLPGVVSSALTVFLGIVQALVQVVPVLLTAVLDLLPSLVTTLLGMLPTLIDAALQLFLGIVTGLLKALPDVIVAVLRILPQLVATLVGIIPVLLDAGVSLFRSLVDAITGSAGDVADVFFDVVAPALLDVLSDVGGRLFQAGVDLVEGLIAGLWDSAGAIADTLLDMVGGAVDGFLSFLGIHSPSRLFAGFGGAMGADLADDLDTLASGVHVTMRADVGPDVGDGVPGAAAAAKARAQARTLNYTQNGGKGIASKEELARAARHVDN